MSLLAPLSLPTHLLKEVKSMTFDKAIIIFTTILAHHHYVGLISVPAGRFAAVAQSKASWGRPMSRLGQQMFFSRKRSANIAAAAPMLVT
ncbi:hypothetical protein [Lysinibacillus sp. CTST325]